jgi:hypothetical protein
MHVPNLKINNPAGAARREPARILAVGHSGRGLAEGDPGEQRYRLWQATDLIFCGYDAMTGTVYLWCLNNGKRKSICYLALIRWRR